MDIPAQKETLRAEMLRLRRSLIEKPISFDFEMSLGLFEHVQTVACYWPLVGEIDPRGLMRDLYEASKKVALPVVVAKDTPLIFRAWKPGDRLIAGPHKTQHPSEDAPQVSPDVIVAPLLAFDQNGGRLGFGGGYYDRTFAAMSVSKVGLAYDEQQVDAVPMDEFDQSLDWIITPTRVIECNR